MGLPISDEFCDLSRLGSRAKAEGHFSHRLTCADSFGISLWPKHKLNRLPVGPDGVGAGKQKEDTSMKTLTYAVVLLAFVGLALLGCADKSQSVVAPTGQAAQVPASLEKSIITNFAFTHSPVGLTGEGDVKLVPGGRWQTKKYGVLEQFVSLDPLATGKMVHHLSLTIDAATGEGPCQGSFTMTPDNNVAEGGVWEGTYEGYRSTTSVEGVWTLPLKAVGHGKGGTIDGMQLFLTSTLTVYPIPGTVLPQYWTGEGEGFYKSH
jgi:hypothetical protein